MDKEERKKRKKDRRKERRRKQGANIYIYIYNRKVEKDEPICHVTMNMYDYLICFSF
jgi:hypothetical protein